MTEMVFILRDRETQEIVSMQESVREEEQKMYIVSRARIPVILGDRDGKRDKNNRTS